MTEPGVTAIGGRAGWVGLLRLAVPVACAGCRRPDAVLCPDCRSRFRGPAFAVQRPGVPVPGWAVARYEGEVAAAVRAWKDEGRLDLGGVLGAALAGALTAALATRGPLRGGGGPVLVVPVPSRRRAVRRRGEDVLAQVAARAVRDLRTAPSVRTTSPVRVVPSLQVVSALRVRRRLQDQAGLGIEQRHRNVAGAFAVRARAAVAGRSCLVVDDVMTTGASAAEAVRALQGAGADVVGVAVVCATPRRRRVFSEWSLD